MSNNYKIFLVYNFDKLLIRTWLTYFRLYNASRTQTSFA